MYTWYPSNDHTRGFNALALSQHNTILITHWFYIECFSMRYCVTWVKDPKLMMSSKISKNCQIRFYNKDTSYVTLIIVSEYYKKRRDICDITMTLLMSVWIVTLLLLCKILRIIIFAKRLSSLTSTNMYLSWAFILPTGY